MKTQLMATTLATTLFAASSAFAADTGFYLGGGIGGTKVKDAPSAAELDAELAAGGITASSSVDDTDTGWKVFGGYKFNRYLAVEGSYADLGEVSITSNVTNPPVGTIDIAWEALSMTVAAVGILPLSYGFELFGKGGLQYWDVDLGAMPFAAITESETGTDYFYGIGAGYNLTHNIALRAEWERYNNVGDENTTGESDVDMWSAGVQFAF